MIARNITYFATQAEFRSWLANNHTSEVELWVGYHKKGSEIESITWPQSVDEALCFGWIDGIRKSVDALRYTIRFTPRKAKSNWSAVNIRRVAELTKLDRMRSAGLKAFQLSGQKNLRNYSYEREHAKLRADMQKQLKANARAWHFFREQPPSYRKVAAWWVVSAKKEETKLKRLSQLIRDSAAEKRIAQLTRPGNTH